MQRWQDAARESVRCLTVAKIITRINYMRALREAPPKEPYFIDLCCEIGIYRAELKRRGVTL